jgi:Pvc16 N-terminal domain
MSNFLAIATVTATFSQTISSAVQASVPGAEVTTQRPHAPEKDEKPHVNIYLYQVTHNAAWINADLPTRRPEGNLVQRPQIALDLHYLLTFYGDETEFVPQRLIGSTLSAIHAKPILTREAIRKLIDTAQYPHLSDEYLETSNLDEQVELIKFSPISMNLEELSKLWSVFFQTPYALSVAYQATVVLIEAELTPQRALPVRDRNIYVMPFRQPVIEQIISSEGANKPIFIDSNLLILGNQLKGDITAIKIGDIEVIPTPENIDANQIILPLLSLDLKAGIQTVQVAHKIKFSNSLSEPHRGFESNVAAFVLHPKITISISSVICTITNGITRCSAEVTVNFTPNVAKKQRVILLLNEFISTPADSAQAYSFNAPLNNGITDPDQDETAAIAIPIKGVAPGIYLVRVQVDGAESNLGTNDAGLYNSPQVTIS